MKNLKFLLLLFILYLVFPLGADIHDIPKGDIHNIKCFFEDLIDRHNFSYTIFGSKPMSLADYRLKCPGPRPPHRWIRSLYQYMQLKAGLNAWYRYRDQFDLKDFIFLDEENDWINDCLVLFLINKKNMLCVLRENESIFKEELGITFNPELFLEKLEKKEESLTKAIKKSQKLMGIMLGYGVTNATLFQKRYTIMKAVWKREKENLQEDEILTKELADIQAQCGDFSELEADAIIHPLYFLADISNSETIALQKKYEKERRLIIQLRKKSNFMDLVLKRLVKAD